LNVALGVVFFRERLRPLQFCALGLAVIGVLNLVFAAGQLPWIALTIASSFAVYGLLRKTAPVDAFIGLSIEAFILLPVALAYGAYLGFTRALHLGAIDRTTDGLLLSSGLVTAVPLLLFGVAARNLRLSTLGFLQFLAPTIQFLLAISVLGETMAPEKWASFACIWVALAVYSIDTGRAMQQLRTERAVIRRWQPQPAVSQID
jgi:chloramphenicol-sensitive protein RarD